MIDLSTPHTRDTGAPQNYFAHAKVACGKSLELILLGVVGVIHGIFPEIKWMQFYTSTGVLKAAKYLMWCGRHDSEIEAIWGKQFLDYVDRWRQHDRSS